MSNEDPTDAGSKSDPRSRWADGPNDWDVDGAVPDPVVDAGPPTYGPCPGPNDPYWDTVFDAAFPYDGSVCGLVERGGPGTTTGGATVTGELYCAIEAHIDPSHPYGDPGCKPICSYFAHMGPLCEARGSLDDAGTCIAQPDASFKVSCGQGGRKPAGFTAAPARGRTRAAAYLAFQASLEAASVPAFVELARELDGRGAPPDLVADCLRAASEEVGHAATVARLARARGGDVPAMRRAPSAHASRSALDLAIDNAVEGLVRETFAAAIAVHQATYAPAPEERAAFQTIARDEISHASLSRRVHAWLVATLHETERAHVRDAMARAIADLAAEISPVVDDSLSSLGLPSPERTRAIHGELQARLWHTDLAGT